MGGFANPPFSPRLMVCKPQFRAEHGPRLVVWTFPFSSRERGFASRSFEPRLMVCKVHFRAETDDLQTPLCHSRAKSGGLQRAETDGLQAPILEPILEPRTGVCKMLFWSRAWVVAIYGWPRTMVWQTPIFEPRSLANGFTIIRAFRVWVV